MSLVQGAIFGTSMLTAYVLLASLAGTMAATLRRRELDTSEANPWKYYVAAAVAFGLAGVIRAGLHASIIPFGVITINLSIVVNVAACAAFWYATFRLPIPEGADPDPLRSAGVVVGLACVLSTLVAVFAGASGLSLNLHASLALASAFLAAGLSHLAWHVRERRSLPRLLAGFAMASAHIVAIHLYVNAFLSGPSSDASDVQAFGRFLRGAFLLLAAGLAWPAFAALRGALATRARIHREEEDEASAA
jgi:hypothetical protein